MVRSTHMPLRAFFALVLVGAAAVAQEPAASPPAVPAAAGATAPDLNVNSRYTVEAVEFVGGKKQVRPEIRQLMDKEVGQKLSQERLDSIVREIKKEFKSYRVSQKVMKGSKPETVKVVLELERRGMEILGTSEDFKFVYSSRNNFSFGGTAEIDLSKQFDLLVGAFTDNDLTVDRSSGIRGGLQFKAFGEHGRIRFVAESTRSQWNGATLAALAANNPEGVPGIYRLRQSFTPEVTVQLLPSLAVSGGVQFNRIQTQFPAARYEAANLAIGGARYAQEFSGAGFNHLLESSYRVRAATGGLGSDFGYTGHTGSVRYSWKDGSRELLILDFRAGALNGRAPLFERFVLGNSQTLRGWNRFDLAPLGGSRMAHGSVEARVAGHWRLIYDAGSVWGESGAAQVRHSAGVGFIKEGLTAVIAFPLRDGNITPIVLLGYTF